MILLIVLVLAVALGAIPASIAKDRGRDPAGWWIFGSLLFIVALPCALFIPRRQPANVLEPVVGDSFATCPHCDEMIRSAAVVCRFCHRDVYVQRPV